MRILIVAEVAPHLPCHDTARAASAHLLRELARRHRLALVGVGARGDSEPQRRWPAAWCTPCDVLPPTPWRRSLTPRPTESLAAIRSAVLNAIERARPEVLYLDGSMAAPLARAAGVPTVLGTSGSRALAARERGDATVTPWERLVARHAEHVETEWERRWFPAADACVVPSESDRAAIVDHVPTKSIDVIPTGIDLDRHAFRRAPRGDRLIFAGDLSLAANVDAAYRLATRILPRVRKVRASTELVLVGPAPSRAVRRLARLAGVTVAGAVSDLRVALSTAAVYVSPLRAHAAATDTILQAMALGTPVVATRRTLAGLDDVLADHHAFIGDRDDEIAEHVAMLLREPIAATTTARNARELVERRYAWPVIARAYETVLARVADGEIERANAA